MRVQFEQSFARLLRNLGSDRSKTAYEKDWYRFCVWLQAEKIEIESVKPRHIEDHILFLQEQKCERSTCARALSVIRAVFGIFVRDELVETNPAREVKNPKFDSQPKTPYLTEAQVKLLFELPEQTWDERRNKLCVQLLIGLGFRRTEAAGLCVGDFVDGTVTAIVKGRKQLTVKVPEWLQTKLNDWVVENGLKKDDPLLIRRVTDRRPITADMVYNIVVVATERVGNKVSPHGLRRTLITIAREHGSDLKTLQLAVGHSSQATTERYDKNRDATKNAPGDVFEVTAQQTTTIYDRRGSEAEDDAVEDL